LVKQKIYWLQLIPFLALVCATSLYTSYDLFQHEQIAGSDMTLRSIMLVLSIYFIAMEIFQIKAEGKEYFKSIWNINDLIPPVLIAVFASA